MPEGDDWSLPPGRRQFRLRGLLWLLTVGAVVMAVGRTLGGGPVELIVALFFTIAVWWQLAEIRGVPIPREPNDRAEKLREEIRRWQAERQVRHPETAGEDDVVGPQAV